MPTWGRGGAGNIVSDEQAKQQNEAATKDLEANRAPVASATSPATSHSPRNLAAEYAHMGRGGAGNWYQPSELEKEGKFSEQSDSTAAPVSSKPLISTPWHPDNQQMPIARAGRGGAGNFVWKDEERDRRMAEEEDRKRQEVGGKVERDVEAGLAKPGAAVLGGVKAGRGW